MESGEIWLVEFPQVGGHEQSGTRPAVVLAEVSGIAIIIPLTSNEMALRFDYTLSTSPTKRNGLSTESVALIFHIRAIDKRRLIRKIGDLEESHMEKIKELVKLLLKI